MTTNTMPRRPVRRADAPITPRTADYLRSLRGDLVDLAVAISTARGAADDAATAEAGRAAALAEVATLTQDRASREIDALRNGTIPTLRRTLRSITPAAAAGAAPATPAVALEADRLYEVDGVFYRTVESRGSGNMYAKVLDVDAGKWVYAPGAIKRILPEHRMSVERAKELSIRFARCIRCWAELTAAESVERAMGPRCVKKI